MAVGAGGSKPDLGRNLRDISGNYSIENIVTENIYGSLNEELISSEMREVAIVGEADKENTIMVDRRNNGKSGVQGKDGKAVGVLKQSVNGLREGKGVNRAGPKQGMTIGPKGKYIKQTRPTRGLVYGPIIRETELSPSGKRMRVEQGTSWQLGGAFASVSNGGPAEEASAMEKSLDIVL